LFQFTSRNWYKILLFGSVAIFFFFTCKSPYTDRSHLALVSPTQELSIEQSFLQLTDKYRPAAPQWIPALPFTPESRANAERIFGNLVKTIEQKMLDERATADSKAFKLKLHTINTGQWTAVGLPAGTIVLSSGMSDRRVMISRGVHVYIRL
jgi:hypothetical protein